jgi:hypothetical protein
MLLLISDVHIYFLVSTDEGGHAKTSESRVGMGGGEEPPMSILMDWMELINTPVPPLLLTEADRRRLARRSEHGLLHRGQGSLDRFWHAWPDVCRFDKEMHTLRLRKRW